jgi:hypothetical protein
MNDEVLHTGYGAMSHYLFALACSRIKWPYIYFSFCKKKYDSKLSLFSKNSKRIQLLPLSTWEYW